MLSKNILSIDVNHYSNRIRNTGLRLLVLNNTNKNLLKKMSNFYKICYNKSIAHIAEGVTEYNSLTEEERAIIETIISLCY